MKRKACILDSNIHGTTFICVDLENASSVMQYIFRDKIDIEFKEIRDILKQNLRNREKYCKADVSAKADNMFEMRFTRNMRNDRIYCQKITINRARHIIMCELYEGKKSQDIPKKIRSRLETMGSYEYEIQR